jgi:hypothetical protein
MLFPKAFLSGQQCRELRWWCQVVTSMTLDLRRVLDEQEEAWVQRFATRWRKPAIVVRLRNGKEGFLKQRKQ